LTAEKIFSLKASFHCFQIFQLMAATRSGICGAGAVSHVVEELRNALVHARNPPLQTVARAAAY